MHEVYYSSVLIAATAYLRHHPSSLTGVRNCLLVLGKCAAVTPVQVQEFPFSPYSFSCAVSIS